MTDPRRRNHIQEAFNLHVRASAGVPGAVTEDIWNHINTGFLKTTEEVCGITRPYGWRREPGGRMSMWERSQAACFQCMKDW